MAYVRLYMDQMLKKHPLGKEFRIIRGLILHDEEGPQAILTSLNKVIDCQGPYWSFCVNKFLRMLFSWLAPRGR